MRARWGPESAPEGPGAGLGTRVQGPHRGSDARAGAGGLGASTRGSGAETGTQRVYRGGSRGERRQEADAAGERGLHWSLSGPQRGQGVYTVRSRCRSWGWRSAGVYLRASGPEQGKGATVRRAESPLGCADGWGQRRVREGHVSSPPPTRGPRSRGWCRTGCRPQPPARLRVPSRAGVRPQARTGSGSLVRFHGGPGGRGRGLVAAAAPSVRVGSARAQVRGGMGDKASEMTGDPPGARAGWLWAHPVPRRGRGMQPLARGCSFLAPSCRPCPAEGNVAPVYTAMRADVVLHTHTYTHTLMALPSPARPGAGAGAGRRPESQRGSPSPAALNSLIRSPSAPEPSGAEPGSSHTPPLSPGWRRGWERREARVRIEAVAQGSCASAGMTVEGGGVRLEERARVLSVPRMLSPASSLPGPCSVPGPGGICPHKVSGDPGSPLPSPPCSSRFSFRIRL